MSAAPTQSVNTVEEENVYMAKLAEQAERYDEMAEYMRKVSNEKKLLDVEQRNLLSVAYKNAVGSRRASWRIISSVEQKEKSKGNKHNEEIACKYRVKVEAELQVICDEIIQVLETVLADVSGTGEAKVFYFKMMGDYYRYVAEFTQGDQKDKASQQADKAYMNATETAKCELVVTHPIRLGLALNYSVFHYEVMNEKQKACGMARTAFEEAIAELDNVSEESYKDSTLIMQLLRDNLTLWTSDETGSNEP